MVVPALVDRHDLLAEVLPCDSRKKAMDAKRPAARTFNQAHYS
jgi:hypothetical protein